MLPGPTAQRERALHDSGRSLVDIADILGLAWVSPQRWHLSVGKVIISCYM